MMRDDVAATGLFASIINDVTGGQPPRTCKQCLQVARSTSAAVTKDRDELSEILG